MSRFPAGPSHNQGAIDRLQPMVGNSDDAVEWQRAYEDALRSLRSIPDPALFAVSIDERHREALRTAWRGSDGWRVHPAYVRELRALGLVEVGGSASDFGANAHNRNYLGPFGNAVRRVVMEAS